MKLKIITITISISVMVILVVIFLNANNNLVNTIVPKQVEKVSIEVMPEVVNITDETEINKVITELKLEEWEKIKEWDLQWSPNLFISFKEGEYIGLFGSGEKYGKVEKQGRGEYYIIPNEIYDNILSIFNANNDNSETDSSERSEDKKETKEVVFNPMDELNVPKKYDPETAIANGDVVNVQGDVTNIEKFNEFMMNYKENTPDLLRTVFYTIEGDPIIQVIYYDGAKVIVYRDSSRDAFGGNNKGIHKFTGNEILEEVYEVEYADGKKAKRIKYLIHVIEENSGDLILMTHGLEDEKYLNESIDESDSQNKSFQTTANIQNTENELKIDFVLENISLQPIEFYFSTGQKYDIFVYDDKDNLVYKWSDGYSFTDAIEEKVLQPKEKLSYIEVLDNKKFKKGTYKIVIKFLTKSKSKEKFNKEELLFEEILEI